VAKPNFIIIDEPSFLDQKAIEWFIEELKNVTKSSNSMVLLVSHKETVMESLADRILHINSESKRLSLFNCSYAIFQTTHSNQQNHARKTLELSKNERHQAQASLEHGKKDLRKREINMKNTPKQNANKRFIKGKAIESKQKAGKSAASKVKPLRKQAEELKDSEISSRQEEITDLHLEGKEIEGVIRGQLILSLNDVSFGYDASSHDVVRCSEYVLAQIMNGERIILTGANGQGKSTLAKLVLGELEPTVGSLSEHVACTCSKLSANGPD
jgi:ATP-binding cassette subfamily F protein 3